MKLFTACNTLEKNATACLKSIGLSTSALNWFRLTGLISKELTHKIPNSFKDGSQCTG